jgi:TRAP-type C4-dicarboxylate transport system permease small subunit
VHAAPIDANDKLEHRAEARPHMGVHTAAARETRGSTVTEAIVRGVHWLLAITRAAAGIFLISSVAINFINIIGRYFFSVSIPWAEEIMLFLMVGCVFTGCCAVAWEGRQIRMDVVVGMLPPKARALVEVLSELTLIAAAAAVTIFAWPVITQLAEFDERSQAANFPLVIPQAMVPIGYTLMALLVALRLLVHRGPRAGLPDNSQS